MQYKANHRMYSLMGGNSHPYAEDQILQVLSRFGIAMGVGDKTIQAVCDEQGVDCNTLLTIVNFAINHELEEEPAVDIATLNRYLENAHAYFLDFQLPRIRQQLADTLDMDSDVQIATLILQFYDEYVREIRTHIEHEKEHSYEQHPRDDEHVAQKARELKGLIIKYYPGNEARGEEGRGGRMQMLYAVLHDLHHFEQELALHCAIEDNIMLPTLRKQLQEESSKNLDNAAGGEVEELSAREVEIVKHIAQGLSNKEIADVLCISTHTVMSHRKNIARKLDIHSTAGLTIYAVVNGIVAL